MAPLPGCSDRKDDCMLQQFQLVWSFFGDVLSALPADVITIGSFVFCGIGIVGFLRSA